MRGDEYGIRVGKNDIYPMCCTACGEFLGWFAHKRTVYCKDILCLITRQWVLENRNDDLVDLIVFLYEDAEIAHTETAELLGLPTSRVRQLYNNYRVRRRYAQV